MILEYLALAISGKDASVPGLFVMEKLPIILRSETAVI